MAPVEPSPVLAHPGHRLVRARVVAAAVAGLLALVDVAGLAPAQAAGAPRPTFSRSPAVPGEAVSATGTLQSRVVRAVTLQSRSGSTWIKTAGGRTTSRGTYRIGFEAPAETTTYRVVARSVTVDGKQYPKLVTDPASLAVRAQTATLTVPATVAAGSNATLVARVAPARVDQLATLQRWVDDAWTDQGEQRTSTSGAATFEQVLTGEGTATFRVVVTGAPATAPVVSPPVSTEVTPPAPVRMSRVSTKAGFVVQMTPDGSQVLWRGPTELWGSPLFVWDRSSRTSTAQPRIPFDHAHISDVTPDLRYAVLTNRDSRGLVVWDRVRDTTRTVVPFAVTGMILEPRISDDGRYLIFSVHNDLTAPGAPATASSNAYLWDAETEQLSALTSPQSEFTGFRMVSISGDGHYLFYESDVREVGTGTSTEGVVIRQDRITGAVQVIDMAGSTAMSESGQTSYDGDDVVLCNRAGASCAYMVWHGDGGYDAIPNAGSENLWVSDLSADGSIVLYTDDVASTSPSGEPRVVSALHSWVVGAPTVRLVSADPAGTAVEGQDGKISADGRYAAFDSREDPTVVGNFKNTWGAFQWDRQG